VIPLKIAPKLTQETHEIMGHPGRYKTYHKLRETCIFKNMHKITAQVTRSCDTCQRCKPVNFNTKGQHTSHKPTEPLETVSIDLMGPLPTGRGGTHYILAILDTFSKFIKLYALKRATTKSIINRLENDYIPHTGKPKSILTDNGTQFTANSWKKKLEELEIERKHSTKYHPQSNPVERYNREIGPLLRTYCNNQHTKWPNKLDQIEEWMNKLRSEVTELTPWEIIKKETPTQPIEKLIKFPEQPPRKYGEDIIQLVANRIKNRADKYEQRYKKGKIEYAIGQQILMKTHDLSNAQNNEIKKLFHIFNGPHTITKVISSNTVEILNGITGKKELANVVEIRPYIQPQYKLQ